MCVPFFIIMAQIMTEGGIADRLTGFCNVIVGRVRGGTAIVNCLNSMLFGGISGSSIADVTSIGALLIPMMQKQGYDTDYSVAVTCTSSVEGVIIPPSQNMIFYVVAASSGLSISTMFMCGYIPGVLFTAALCLTSYIIAVKKKYPISEAHSLKEKYYHCPPGTFRSGNHRNRGSRNFGRYLYCNRSRCSGSSLCMVYHYFCI